MTRFLLLAMLICGIGSLSTISCFAEEKKADKAEKVERLHADQWCFKHDLPKDKDIECDKTLIPKLKKEGDWCKEHAFAESVCRKCDPKEAKEYIDARRPDSKEWPAGWKPTDDAATKDK